MMKHKEQLILFCKKKYKKLYFYNDVLVKDGNDLEGICPECKKYISFNVQLYDNRLCVNSRCCNILWEMRDNIECYINFSNIIETKIVETIEYNKKDIFRFRYDPIDVGSKYKNRKIKFKRIFNISMSCYRNMYDEQVFNDLDIKFYNVRISSRYKLGYYNWAGDYFKENKIRSWKNKKCKKQWMKNM